MVAVLLPETSQPPRGTRCSAKSMFKLREEAQGRKVGRKPFRSPPPGNGTTAYTCIEISKGVVYCF